MYGHQIEKGTRPYWHESGCLNCSVWGCEAHDSSMALWVLLNELTAKMDLHIMASQLHRGYRSRVLAYNRFLLLACAVCLFGFDDHNRKGGVGRG